MIKKILGWAIYLCLVTTTTFAQDKITLRIDSLMRAVSEIGIFNGNVLVKQHGKKVYEQSFGYADGARTKKLTINHMFDIGSISKEFNGTAIMLLKEKGKLNLEDKLSKFIKDLPRWTDSIKIKHLLNYTSGLPESGVFSDEALLTELKQLKSLAFTPGKSYIYSYANVYLQRKVVEAISGMSYNDFVVKNLLKPLKMEHTIMDLSTEDPRMAKAFDGNFKESTYLQQISGWPRTTVSDLEIWLGALDSYKILSKESLKLLAVAFGDNESSLGSATFVNDELTWHQHHGSNYNYEALITHDVEHGISIVLTTNSQQFKVNAITRAIISILKNEPYIVPKKSLYLELREKVLANFNDGLLFYRQVTENEADKYDLSFEFGDLINTGKYLMRRKLYDDAIAIFQLGNTLNVKATDFSYSYQLIAECYVKKQLPQLAIAYYRKSTEKDSTNLVAKGFLAELLK